MSFCTATVPPLEVVAVKFRENVVDSFTGGVSRVRPRAEGPGEPLQPQREHQQLPGDPRPGRDRWGGGCFKIILNTFFLFYFHKEDE